ncbi:hypothetical protein FQR65_LT04704 [Abscondita terminalis]|nr:hypothetical protein FQR65_LT04704 [Abscondita terminalis]
MLKTRERIELFLVNVTVIEGRHFPKKYKYSAVHVRVGNKKKCTPICFTSESPYFNEFYVFEFSTTMEQFLDTSITLTAFRPRRRLLSRKIIGYVTLDAATVWSAEDHQFYHKWAILLPPVKDVKMAVRGFLKVDIAIIRKGEKFKIPIIDIQSTDEIEGNFLQTHSYTAERLRANYTFIVYYGIAFGKGKYSDLKYTVETERDLPKIYVEILFAGRKGRTSTIKGNSNPVWNESIVIPEYFPPLCQRIRINVFNRDKYSRTLISSRIVDLSLICNYDEPGFLPTFGPTFFHFYVKRNKNETYVGKILIAFYTNLPLNESDVVKHVEVKKTSGIREVSL